MAGLVATLGPAVTGGALVAIDAVRRYEPDPAKLTVNSVLPVIATDSVRQDVRP